MWEPLAQKRHKIGVQLNQILVKLYTPKWRFESCPLGGTTNLITMNSRLHFPGSGFVLMLVRYRSRVPPVQT